MVLCLMTLHLSNDILFNDRKKWLLFGDAGPDQLMDTSWQNTNCAFTVVPTVCRHNSFLELPRTSLRMS